MNAGLDTSRKSLESQRKKARTDVDAVEVEIAEAERKLELLTDRRAFLLGQIDELTVGIDALQEVVRDGASEA
jgi:cell division protein FtsB